jgi:hypothetical protein
MSSVMRERVGERECRDGDFEGDRGRIRIEVGEKRRAGGASRTLNADMSRLCFAIVVDGCCCAGAGVAGSCNLEEDGGCSINSSHGGEGVVFLWCPVSVELRVCWCGGRGEDRDGFLWLSVFDVGMSYRLTSMT